MKSKSKAAVPGCWENQLRELIYRYNRTALRFENGAALMGIDERMMRRLLKFSAGWRRIYR